MNRDGTDWRIGRRGRGLLHAGQGASRASAASESRVGATRSRRDERRSRPPVRRFEAGRQSGAAGWAQHAPGATLAAAAPSLAAAAPAADANCKRLRAQRERRAGAPRSVPSPEADRLLGGPSGTIATCGQRLPFFARHSADARGKTWPAFREVPLHARGAACRRRTQPYRAASVQAVSSAPPAPWQRTRRTLSPLGARTAPRSTRRPPHLTSLADLCLRMQDADAAP
jgi:hypothetical protein